MRPEWLNKKIDLKDYDKMRARLKPFGLHTVCEEAMCPNISECFSRGTATFLIGGDICTRNCKFCGVHNNTPKPLDENEPQRVADAIAELGLDYAVITGVTRDDVEDKGALHYAETVLTIMRKAQELEKDIKVEVLTPDFDGLRNNIELVTLANPYIFAHNIETVQGLYEKCGRDMYRYDVSLSVLETVKCINKEMKTKSSIMLGLGETEDEVMRVFEDLSEIKCDYLSIGQYLAPSKDHIQVVEYITPEQFDYYRTKALDFGFKDVKSGPYVRSSYMADQYE